MKGTRPVAPRSPEGPLDLAVAAELKATLGEGRAADIADEGLEALPFVGRDAGGRVQREAVGVRDQGAWVRGRVRTGARVCSRIAEARHRAARVGAEGDAALDRGGLEEREEGVRGVVRRSGVRARIVAAILASRSPDQVAAAGGAEDAVNAADGVAVHSPDLFGRELVRREEAWGIGGAAGDMDPIQEEGRGQNGVQTHTRPSASTTYGDVEWIGLFPHFFLYSSTLNTLPAVRMARLRSGIFDTLIDSGLFTGAGLDYGGYTLGSPGDRIVRNHATYLLPLAVGRSSAVLDHFFRLQIEPRMEYGPSGEASLMLMNQSSLPGAVAADLTLAGGATLDVYYEDGVRARLAGSRLAAVSLGAVAPFTEIEVPGDLEGAMADLADPAQTPANLLAREDRLVTLLIKGQVGAEPAVTAARLNLGGFRIVEFDAPEFIYDDRNEDMTIHWEGAPTFPVSFKMDKIQCNSSFWSDCDDDEARTFFVEANPLVAPWGITGCALASEYIYAECWLEDANGRRTQRVPWSVTGVFQGSQCVEAPVGSGSGSLTSPD